MPTLKVQGFDPDAYLTRGELGWELESVEAYDGLQPTRIVRSFRAPEGVDSAEGTALPFRLDASPDADDRSNAAALVTTDAHRYVANPHVLKHQFRGLWTGGPVRWVLDQASMRHRLKQQLVRTFCAGHGYTLAPDGSIASMEGPEEFATVADALASHRPAVRRFFNSRLAFRPDIPGSYRTEIKWRDFTHESWPHLESEEGKAAAAAAAKKFFGDNVGEISEVHCEIDAETNTVVFVAAALFKQAAEPEDAAALVALPWTEGPCTRETLRPEGWGFGEGGEGLRITHSFRWSDLRDTSAVRALAEFPDERALLPALFAADFRAENPVWSQSGARWVCPDGAPWWRLGRVEVATQDDGLLSLVVPATRSVWSGSAAALRSAIENPGGWAATERRTAPSVPEQ
ncbi:MAG: hypothetical protein IJ678_03640, partial [Kiritimatiellae bacterium]|nr:hypothetical protein [Kiritimatiellia bacterium]